MDEKPKVNPSEEKNPEKIPVPHFIRKIIEDDLAAGRCRQLVTRFPPEPNGYLHIGHAKSICLNFTLSQDYGGRCHLRFDDTNPCNESDEFARAIEQDVRWLGFDWGPHYYHASDYFDQLYAFALHLIRNGKAYVDSLSMEDIRVYRGTLSVPGRNSPDRDRSVAENTALFEEMKRGVYREGQYVLRAKIDMAAGNMNLRDPPLYRIRSVPHQRTGDTWCIYPMYDFAHALSDALEGVTHSLCTLEFQDHRPLYHWLIDACSDSELPVLISRPEQIEFSRLNLSYTVTSKRKLKQLVDEGVVTGWDDPRMPTLSGLRRRGVPPEAIVRFCEKIGISKQDSVIEMRVFEDEIRDHLNIHAPRTMAILEPIRVVIDNYPPDQTELFNVAVHPQNPAAGEQSLLFGPEVYIDADDFREQADKDFFGLTLSGGVRLRNAYVIYADRVVKNQQGQIVQIHCHYDPATAHGVKPANGQKIKGIIHWVCCTNAVDATIRCYDHLFTCADPSLEDNILDSINPDSLTVYQAKIESTLALCQPEERFQFVRLGYFVADVQEHTASHPVFNQIVSLKSDFKKLR